MQSQMRRVSHSARRTAAIDRVAVRRSTVARAAAEQVAPAAEPAAPVEQKRPRQRAPISRTPRSDLTFTPEQLAAIQDSRLLKVAGTSVPGKLAGKIAINTRAGAPPSCSCIGPASINQAVKAVAIARKYLIEDKIDLSFQPEFDTDGIDAPIISINLFKAGGAAFVPIDLTGPGVVLFKVSPSTGQTTLAGAIASNVRNSKEVVLDAIGAGSVSNSVLAIAIARRFLKEEKYDLRVQPEFFQRESNDGTINGVRLQVVVDKL